MGPARDGSVKRPRIRDGVEGAYSSWRGMCERCSNTNHVGWSRYGGRGIVVFPEWTGRGGFDRFLAYLGKRPPGMSIDRINSDGNYEPGNVRWADKYMQAANRSPESIARRAKWRRWRAVRKAKWSLERFGRVMSMRETERMMGQIQSDLETEFGALPTWIEAPKERLCIEEAFLAGDFTTVSSYWEGLDGLYAGFAGHGTWEQLTGKAALARHWKAA